LPSELSKNVKINVTNGPTKEKVLAEVKAAGPATIRFISEKIIDAEIDKQCELEFFCSAQGVVNFIDIIKAHYESSALSTLRIHELDKPLWKNAGLGRLGTLKEPITIQQVVDKLKSITGLSHVRLALANGKTLNDTVKSIAIGAGSGSKLLNDVNADIIITGEFDHHEILHENHRGVSVILTDHTNTERCYFKYFREKFTQLLSQYDESVEIMISTTDRDPLQVI